MTSVLLVGLHHTYQYKQAVKPSELEKSQREGFARCVRGLIDSFYPTIIADESPDTNNPELLALYPQNTLKLCVDVPFSVKMKSNLMVGRPEDGLCPYVDELREKFWERRLRHAAAGNPHSRILMFCGAQHLYSFPLKPACFVDHLVRGKYETSFVDLRKESWWDEGWIKGWVDPDPLPACLRRPCCVFLGADHKNCALQSRYRSYGRRLQMLMSVNRKS